MGALIAAFVAVGCSTVVPEPEPCWTTTPEMCGMGATCRTGADCTSGVCRSGVCTTCFGSWECGPSEACLSGACSTSCIPTDILGSDRDRVCDQGRVATCDTVADPESYCSVCDCPSGNRCSSFNCNNGDCSCIPLAPVGAACQSNLDCASRNCSSFAGVCRVALGTTCTMEDCDVCLTWTNGTSYCTGDCDGASDCGNGFCSGAYADIPYRECFPRCGGRDCDCRTAADGVTTYCACGGSATDCERLEEQHEPLQACGGFNSDGPDCATGSCVGRAVCGGSCYIWGYCGDTCTTDAECGAEGVCGRLPCGGASCPAVCMPRCPESGRCEGEGSCQSVPGVAGGEIMACTTKLPTGSACATEDDCISAVCSSRRCL